MRRVRVRSVVSCLTELFSFTSRAFVPQCTVISLAIIAKEYCWNPVGHCTPSAIPLCVQPCSSIAREMLEVQCNFKCHAQGPSFTMKYTVVLTGHSLSTMSTFARYTEEHQGPLNIKFCLPWSTSGENANLTSSRQLKAPICFF